MALSIKNFCYNRNLIMSRGFRTPYNLYKGKLIFVLIYMYLIKYVLRVLLRLYYKVKLRNSKNAVGIKNTHTAHLKNIIK